MPNFFRPAAVLNWPPSFKRRAAMAMDTVLALLAMWLAFTLRLDTLHWPSPHQWGLYLAAPLLSVPLFAYFGLYRAILRYAGLASLNAAAKATALYVVLLSALLVGM